MLRRYENEQPFKKAVQEEIGSLFKVIDDANLTKTELEEQMEDMRAELRNLEHEHEQVTVTFQELDHPSGPPPDRIT